MVKQKSLTRFAILLIVFFLILSVPAFFLGNIIQTDSIRASVLSFGFFAPLVFILATSVTNILPSVAALPFWLVGVTLFGPPAYIYILISNTFGSLVNYLLAKKLGRMVIARFVGQAGLAEVDRVAGFTSAKTIFYLRLVGGVMTDYISYAAGLMQINLRVYLAATILGGLPMNILAFIIIHQSLQKGLLATAGWLGLFYLINYLSSLLIVPLVLKSFRKIGPVT